MLLELALPLFVPLMVVFDALPLFALIIFTLLLPAADVIAGTAAPLATLMTPDGLPLAVGLGWISNRGAPIMEYFAIEK